MGDGVNIAARLEGIAKPGAICLSEDAYRQVKSRLDLAVSDLGLTQLKNIAEPIRVYSLEVGRPAQVKQPAASTPPRLSIVVLPFANLGGDPEQEYFVDGVTESLTTDLSRIAGSFVIGRNTAFTYKGKHIDLKQIGRELNVRYVLEGSVQRSSNRLRVNVQLIDAGSGTHLWAERFDKPVADLFDMQDEIVSRLANALNAELIAAEANRAEHSPHPDSMDFYFQGAAWMNRGTSPEYMTQARGYFGRALALDPGNVEALVGMARVDSQRGAYFMADDRAAHLAAAEATLTKVVSFAPNHPMAHYLTGLVEIFSNRPAQGIAECERALALDRNLAAAHALIGCAKLVTGRGKETEAHVQEALRLSPRDTSAHVWLVWVGNANAQLSADEEAVAWFRRGLEANRNLAVSHFFLAAALAYLDRLDEARAAAQSGLALDPSFTIRRFRLGAATRQSDLSCRTRARL
jgi:TolB-like protein